MGLTPDQKMELAISYIKDCQDILYIIEIEELCALKKNELLKRL